MAIDYRSGRILLDSEFSDAEAAILAGHPNCPISSAISLDLDVLFPSETQAFREALLGCVLAKILEPGIDPTKPYMSHGDDAFNGRSLDFATINPFLQDHRIPSTKGPYLSNWSFAFQPKCN